MSDLERMVWAAAFVASLRSRCEPYACAEEAEAKVRAAAAEADWIAKVWRQYGPTR